jgi:hypothetical protein
MDETQPELGILIALLFIAVGVVAVAMPERLQRLTIRNYEQASFRPFRSFVEGGLYQPVMRVMGWMMLVVGLLVLVASILELLQKTNG